MKNDLTHDELLQVLKNQSPVDESDVQITGNTSITSPQET
jgi:hypothetical protein